MAENEKGGYDLPMSLTKEDLPKVEIFYGFYSTKTGAGIQEIRIHGTGQVVLTRTGLRNAPVETRQGSLPPETVVRLIELMDDQGFLALEDAYPAKGRRSPRRIVSISAPTFSKKVVIDDPTSLELERVAGAISLAAGIAQPEALQHRFFSGL